MSFVNIIVLALCVVMVTSTEETFFIDSYDHCNDWAEFLWSDDVGKVSAGRSGAQGYDKSSKTTCNLPFSTGDEKIFKVEVTHAEFTYPGVSVTFYDARVGTPDTFKFSLNKTNTTLQTMKSSADYICLSLNKTGCESKHSVDVCKDSFDVRIKVTVENHPDYHDPRTTEHDPLNIIIIVASVIGGLFGLGLLIGVPLCIVCCCMAAKQQERRRQNVGAVTAYPAQQQVAPGYPQQQQQQYPGQAQSPYPVQQQTAPYPVQQQTAPYPVQQMYYAAPPQGPQPGQQVELAEEPCANQTEAQQQTRPSQEKFDMEVK